MISIRIIVKSDVNVMGGKLNLSPLIKHIRKQGREVKKMKDVICNHSRQINELQKRISKLENLLEIVFHDQGKEPTSGISVFVFSKEEMEKSSKIIFDTTICSCEIDLQSLFIEMDFGATYKMASPSGSPRPGTPTTQPGTFDDQFKLFAKFGDTKNTGEVITLSNSDKWFKQAKIIDGKNVTTTDTGIYFKKIAKTKRALNKKEYLLFLDTIASNRKVDFEGIKEKLSSCGPPATSGTTPIAIGGAVSRLTDHTKFTGTHKQRFDDSGKGRGKEGRVDIQDDSGYVRGYKAQGSYNKTH